MENSQEKFSDINILLISEKGVDKSAFVNAFKNYLTFESPNDALKMGPYWFPPTTTEEVKDTIINLHYERFRFINTQGLSGSNEPEENLRRLNGVVSHFAKPTYLKSIVFLLKPDVKRSKKFLKLHFDLFKEALTSKYFTFIFVHDERTFAKRVECEASLTSLFEEMKLNVTNEENVLHFKQVLKSELCLTAKVDEFTNNWEESVKFCEHLFDCFTGAQPFSVKQIVDSQSVMRIVDNVTYLLYEISLVFEDNLKNLENKIQASINSNTQASSNTNNGFNTESKGIFGNPVKSSPFSFSVLSENLANPIATTSFSNYRSLNMLTIDSFGSFITICESERCAKRIKHNDVSVCRGRNCHDPCKCGKSCEIFYFPSKTCSMCQCSASKHSRVLHTKNYQTEKENMPVDLPKVIEIYEHDKMYILNLLATFVAYKKQGKCLYKKYLEDKIDADTRNPSPYKQLQVQYDKILYDTLKSSVQIAPETLLIYIQDLYQLERAGKMISPSFRAAFLQPIMTLEISDDTSALQSLLLVEEQIVGGEKMVNDLNATIENVEKQSEAGSDKQTLKTLLTELNNEKDELKLIIKELKNEAKSGRASSLNFNNIENENEAKCYAGDKLDNDKINQL